MRVQIFSADSVVSQQRKNGHPKHGTTVVCTKLKSPTALEMRQLKRLLRYVKGTEDMSTVFESVTAMTKENSWSNDWKSTQTLIGRVIK